MRSTGEGSFEALLLGGKPMYSFRVQGERPAVKIGGMRAVSTAEQSNATFNSSGQQCPFATDITKDIVRARGQPGHTLPYTEPAEGVHSAAGPCRPAARACKCGGRQHDGQP